MSILFLAKLFLVFFGDISNSKVHLDLFGCFWKQHSTNTKDDSNELKFQFYFFYSAKWGSDEVSILTPLLTLRCLISTSLLEMLIAKLLFRAQFGEDSTVTTEISSIKLDTVSARGSEVAAFVEQCRCPPGYTGLSCEQCAPGYERDQASTSFLYFFSSASQAMVHFFMFIMQV